MQSKRKLTVIMVTYNSFPFFKNSTELLLKHIQDIELEIIIVDNNSPDKETHTYLDELLNLNSNNIKVVKLDFNSGYQTALNVGVNYAKNEFILCLDNDVFVDEKSNDYFVKMYDLMENNLDYGIISPLFNKMDGTPDINYYITFNVLNMIYERFSRIFSDKSKHKSLDNLHKLPKDKNGCYSVRLISLQFFLMRKSVYFNVLKGMDTRYFLGVGDSDMCENINFHGLKNVIYPEAHLVHGVSLSNSKSSYIATYEMIKTFGQFLLKWRIFPFFRNTIYKILFIIPTWMDIIFRRINGNKNVSD